MHGAIADRQYIEEMSPYLIQWPKNAQPGAILFQSIDPPPPDLK